MGHRRRALAAHGAYFLVTGAAPFVSRRAFEAVTGRKREWWLVQTVGALTMSTGAGVAAAAARDRITAEVLGVAAASSAGLAAIDVVYGLRRRISPVYLGDAAVQAALLGMLARAAVGTASRG